MESAKPKQETSYVEFLEEYTKHIYALQSEIFNNLKSDDKELFGTDHHKELFINELWILRFVMLRWWLIEARGSSDDGIDSNFNLALFAFMETPRKAGLPKRELDDLVKSMTEGMREYNATFAEEFIDKPISEKQTVEKFYCRHFASRMINILTREKGGVDKSDASLVVEWIIRGETLAGLAEGITTIDHNLLIKGAEDYDFADDWGKCKKQSLPESIKASDRMVDEIVSREVANEADEKHKTKTMSKFNLQGANLLIAIAGGIIVIVLGYVLYNNYAKSQAIKSCADFLHNYVNSESYSRQYDACLHQYGY